MKSFISLIFLILTLLFPLTSHSKVYYVAQTNSGIGDGSSFSNRMSVSNHNSGSFSAGDTILVDKITSKVRVPSSGKSGNEITYRGDYAGHAGVLDFNGNPMVDTNSKDYIIIDGLEFKNGKTGIRPYHSDYITIKNCIIHEMETKGITIQYSTNVTVGGTKGDGNDIYNIGIDTGGTDVVASNSYNVTISYNNLYATNTSYGIDGVALIVCNNVLIEYNTIYSHNHSGSDAGEDGIDLKQNNYDITIRYNHIYDHQHQSGITVQMGTHNTDIYGNQIHDNFWAGVYIKKGNIGSTNMKDINVWDNVIYNNGSGVYVASSGTAPITLTDVEIYNNVLAENGSHKGTIQSGGVGIGYGSGHSIKNNIFYKNHGAYTGNIYEQVYLYKNSAAKFDYNYYYYPGVSGRDMFKVAGVGKMLTEIKALGQESSGAEGNPKFTDAHSNDYTLKSDSPCINTGTALGSTYAKALDPDQTDFTADPPRIRRENQNDYGSWEIGAYIYKKSGTAPSPPTTVPSPPTGLIVQQPSN